MSATRQNTSNIVIEKETENICYTNELSSEENQNIQAKYDRITIIHQNVQSIGNCVNRLEQFLLNYPDCSFLGISEHWKTESQLRNYGINGFYLAEAVCRENENQHGGTAIFARKGIPFKTLPKITALSKVGICECSVCEFEVGNQNIIILCVYTPGGMVTAFLECLEKILSTLASYTGHIFLVGDFNIHMHENDRNVDKEALLSLLASYNLFSLVVDYTRVTNTSKSLIDNIFTNLNKDYEVKVIHNSISDHAAQSVSFLSEDRDEFVFKRIFNASNIDDFRRRLGQEDWSKMYEASGANNIWEYFYMIFLHHFNFSFPIRKIKLRRKKQNQQVTDPELEWCKKQLDILYVLSCVDTSLNRQYKEVKKIYENTLAKKKAEHYQHKIEQSDNKSKTVWSIINNIRNGADPPRDIQIHGDGKIIADRFNNFFLNYTKDLVPNITTENICLEQIDRSLFLKPITEIEILSIIKNLKNKHSSGDDEVPTSLIRSVIHEIITPLTYTIDSSFRAGVFPDSLKLATIRPVHKTGSVTDMANYRPISLLPSFSKVFEKCMSNRLVEFFLRNDLFNGGQHAYLKGRGTHTALYEFTEAVLQAMESGVLSMGLFLDLSKAYDSVNHRRLLNKLMRYGIAGTAYKWLESYLSGRLQQTVVMKGGRSFKSDKKEISMGIPQGGIVLFIIYVNDSPEPIASSNSVHLDYADDKNILIISDTLQTLLDDLTNTFESVSHWVTNEALVLNERKTNCVIFRTNRSKIDYPNTVYLNEAEINVSNETKFLGLMVDETLSWGCHIEKLNNRLNSVCYTLRVMTKYLDESGLRVVYFSNFESIVRYGIVFYGGSKSMEKIFLSQKRAIRIIKKLSFRTSCRGIFRQNRILTVSALYIKECIMFILKNREYFHENVPTHSYNNRNQLYVYPVHRLSITERGAKYSCIKFFNALPSRIRFIQDDKIFKKEVHKFLIQLEPYTVNEYLSSR